MSALAPVARRGLRHLSVQATLEWAFSTECVALEFDDFAPRRGVGIEAVLMEQAQLGARIDGGGHTPKASDAEIIASVVAAFGLRRGRGLAVAVAECARARGTPDWMPGAAPRLVPLAWKRASRHGGPMAHTDRCGVHEEVSYLPNPRNPAVQIRRVRRTEIRYCPCHWQPTPAAIAAARRAYLDWWGALLDLRMSLRGSLETLALTDEMPPKAPWRR